jgi:hypothetical protein
VAASRLVNQSGGGLRPPPVVPLYDLRDLPGFQAARADTHATRAARDESPDRDEIRQPSPLRVPVGVTHRVTDGRTFTADIAPLGHARSCWTEYMGSARRTPRAPLRFGPEVNPGLREDAWALNS